MTKHDINMTSLTEKKLGDGALKLEEVPDDGPAAAGGGWGGVHGCDVGEALAVLSINGVPHQARSSKQSVLRPAANTHMMPNRDD